MNLAEEELRELCARIVSAQSERADEELLGSSSETVSEVESRLRACGMRLWRRGGEAPVALIAEERDTLSPLARSALAICALELHPEIATAERRRIAVAELTERLPGAHNQAYVRRAALGPLEHRGLIRVVKPGQRAREAYVVAGPVLGAIDQAALRARLDAHSAAAV